MFRTNDELISVLNNLIETCKDGQEGFKKAAENIKNSELKSLFYDYSQQRARFAGELQNEVLRLGGDPEKTGSVAGNIHRGWMDVKAALTSQDETSILAECERGEDSAVKNYQEAIDEGLPSDIAAIVNSQYAEIKAAHDQIRSLRDVGKNRTARA